MWPSKNKKGTKSFSIEMTKLYEKFGTVILSDWIQNTFDEKTILICGVDELIKIANCENCENYVGVNPIIRKKKNILVLSGFCNFFDDGIRDPENFVCGSFEPRNIYKKIIITKINRLSKCG